MIVSMKPPYEITTAILQYVSSISEKIGGIKANFLDKPSPALGKQNRIRTIHSSLGIEGNTLTREQITDIIDNKRIAGPKKDILEVQNAIKVYDRLKEFDPFQPKPFLLAHRELMKGLIDEPGNYRTKSVGIVH